MNQNSISHTLVFMLIVCLLLLSGAAAETPTDEELKALEQEIEQQEVEQAEAEERKQQEAEAVKRKEEARLTEEAAKCGQEQVSPVTRINPDYPQSALSRGIQGWVVIQFTITAGGTVKDAKVVDAEPKNIFDDAAVKAFLRWRYNPKVVDGQAVECVSQTKLVFEFER